RRLRQPFDSIGQRGTSPSPPLEERAGERRPFIRKRWDFLVRSTASQQAAPFTCTKNEMPPPALAARFALLAGHNFHTQCSVIPPSSPFSETSLNRRHFMKQTAVGIAGAALTSSTRAVFAAEKKVGVGVQLYSVRDQCAADLPGTLAAVSKIGY